MKIPFNNPTGRKAYKASNRAYRKKLATRRSNLCTTLLSPTRYFLSSYVFGNMRRDPKRLNKGAKINRQPLCVGRPFFRVSRTLD